MATTTKTTTATKAHINHNKAQTQHAKPKRRKCRETTISNSAAEFSCHVSQPTVVSTDNTWCFPATKPAVPPPPPPPPSPPTLPRQRVQTVTTASYQPPSPCSSPSTFRIRFSPGSLSPVMDFTTAVNGASNGNGHGSFGGHHSHNQHDATASFPSSFSKFNSVLTAGLLNPMSPPPPTDKTRSSPTLFEMMASEPDVHPRTQIQSSNVALTSQRNPSGVVLTVQDKQAMAMQRISEILSSRSPGNQFDDSSSSDIKLTLSSRDGISVSMNVHRQILVAHSRFFAVKLSDRWAKQQRSAAGGTASAASPHIVEIADCEDVEVYIETLRLMYCKDLRKKLMKEDVPKVLGILKVTKPHNIVNFLLGILWPF